MGMLFVLIFWAVIFLLLSLVSGLLTLPFTYFLCKEQRKRRMTLCFLTPGVALFTYAASSLVAMITIAIILGTDIGIGDSWSTPLKNNYELSSTDTPDNGGICKKDDLYNEILISDVTHIQVIGDSVIGKADGRYFIFNLQDRTHTDSLTYQALTRQISPSSIHLIDTNTYYWDQRRTAYIIGGVLSLLLTVLVVRLFWRIGLHGFQRRQQGS